MVRRFIGSAPFGSGWSGCSWCAGCMTGGLDVGCRVCAAVGECCRGGGGLKTKSRVNCLCSPSYHVKPQSSFSRSG